MFAQARGERRPTQPRRRSTPTTQSLNQPATVSPGWRSRRSNAQWPADISRRVPPLPGIAGQRLRPHAEWPADVAARVPPLPGLAGQRLGSDAQWQAGLAERLPILPGLALRRAHRRRPDRRDCHRRCRQHDDCRQPAHQISHRTSLGKHVKGCYSRHGNGRASCDTRSHQRVCCSGHPSHRRVQSRSGLGGPGRAPAARFGPASMRPCNSRPGSSAAGWNGRSKSS